MSENKSIESSAATEKTSTARRTFKNAGMLMFGTVFRMFVSFVFILVVANRLGLTNFGVYSIAIHYFELFLSISATAVGILLTREIAKFREDKFKVERLVTAALVLGVLLALGGMALIATLPYLFSYSTITHQVCLLAALALIPATISSVVESIFIAYERTEFVAVALLIESSIRLVASIVLVLNGFGLITLFLILIATRLLQASILMVMMRSAIGLRMQFSFSQLVSFTKNWRVFAGETWMATLYCNLDVVVLSWISGENAVGLYSAAWKIIGLLSVVAKAYTTAVFPMLSRIYQQSKEQFETASLNTIRMMIVVAIPSIVAITIFADRVIGLLFDLDEYSDAVPILQILVWVLLLEFLNPFLSYTLFAQGREKRSMQVAGISLIANSGITFALVYQFGAAGAALGTVVAGLIATVSYLCFAFQSRGIFQTLSSLARAMVASGVMGGLLFCFRDENLLLLVLGGALAYVTLAILMNLIKKEDLQLLVSICGGKSVVVP